MDTWIHATTYLIVTVHVFNRHTGSRGADTRLEGFAVDICLGHLCFVVFFEAALAALALVQPHGGDDEADGDAGEERAERCRDDGPAGLVFGAGGCGGGLVHGCRGAGSCKWGLRS